MLRRLLFILISLTGLFAILFLLSPVLFNTFLQPKITESLPFAHSSLRLLSLTPRLLEASFASGTPEQTGLQLPRIELELPHSSLSQPRIPRLRLLSPSISLKITEQGMELPGLLPFPTDESAGTEPEQQHNHLPVPIMVDDIEVANGSVRIQREHFPDLSIGFSGTIHLEYSQNENTPPVLIGARLSLQLTGPAALKIDGTLSSSASGYLIKGESEIGHLSQLLPQLFPAESASMPPSPSGSTTSAISVSGAIKTEFTIGIDSGPKLRDFHVKLTPRDFTLSIGQRQIVTTASPSPGPSPEVTLEGTPGEVTLTLSRLGLGFPATGEIDGSLSYRFLPRSFNGLARLSLKDYFTQATVRLDGTMGDKGPAANLDLVLDKAQVAGLRIDGVTAHTTFDPASEDRFANTSLQTRRVIDDSLGLEVHGIRLDLPLERQGATIQLGRGAQLAIKNISYGGNELARAHMTVSQKGQGYSYDLQLTATQPSTLAIDCAGSASPNPSSITGSCLLEDTPIDEGQLPGWMELPSDLQFSAQVAARAEYALSRQAIQANLTASLEKGSVQMGETRLHDIETTLVFPALPYLRSAPDQVLKIAAIEAGRLSLTNGELHYRIEDPDSLLVEKLQLDWCGGSLESNSFRLRPSTEKIDTTLYADRIKLSQVLEQFGLQDTEGEGSLNGRLPVTISRSGIRFDDGFLFSTPGESGIVRFHNTSQLRQGLGSARSASLDYTMQALEDFSYNWTRLSFNSVGGDLLLKLNLDGKPSVPLPFGYRNGQIMATTDGPGLQHPVRLDVNFRLPLDEIFRYSNEIQALMEKVQ